MNCPNCGSELVRETRRVPYNYHGHILTVDQPGDWCSECGEGVLSDEDMFATLDDLIRQLD